MQENLIFFFIMCGPASVICTVIDGSYCHAMTVDGPYLPDLAGAAQLRASDAAAAADILLNVCNRLSSLKSHMAGRVILQWSVES
jgi:hypothetical protein